LVVVIIVWRPLWKRGADVAVWILTVVRAGVVVRRLGIGGRRARRRLVFGVGFGHAVGAEKDG